MTRESVYVGGRYLKYTRDVSQTPWTIGTTVLAELSVSGIVCETVKKAFKADGRHAAGGSFQQFELKVDMCINFLHLLIRLQICYSWA